MYRDIEYSLVQILDLALCRRECIFDRDHDVLVFGRVAMSLADEDILVLRDRDANIDREQLAFAAPHRRCDDRHVTARYPVIEFFQPLGLSFDFGPDCLRGLGILEGDIERHLHIMSLYHEMCNAFLNGRAMFPKPRKWLAEWQAETGAARDLQS
ncbi:MAG: hypothetical protein WA231_00245 [Methylocella sp.]